MDPIRSNLATSGAAVTRTQSSQPLATRRNRTASDPDPPLAKFSGRSITGDKAVACLRCGDVIGTSTGSVKLHVDKRHDGQPTTFCIVNELHDSELLTLEMNERTRRGKDGLWSGLTKHVNELRALEGKLMRKPGNEELSMVRKNIYFAVDEYNQLRGGYKLELPPGGLKPFFQVYPTGTVVAANGSSVSAAHSASAGPAARMGTVTGGGGNTVNQHASGSAAAVTAPLVKPPIPAYGPRPPRATLDDISRGVSRAPPSESAPAGSTTGSDVRRATRSSSTHNANSGTRTGQPPPSS